MDRCPRVRFGMISPDMRQAGFTWIELVLILAVVAILGAMAIPGMQDTALKKQVREGLDLADVAKKGVQAYWTTSGELPKNNDEAGIPAKDKIVGSMVKEVEVDHGAIHVTFGNNASKALAGMRVTLRPAVVKDEPKVPIAWLCHNVPVPDKMEVKGHNRTDIPPKWLPVECRGGEKK
jgi:type IV pilus assembly protein PilA